LPTLCTAALALDNIPVLPADAGQQWKPVQCDNLGGRVTLAGSVHSYPPQLAFTLHWHVHLFHLTLTYADLTIGDAALCYPVSLLHYHLSLHPF
jgi:hypothetical protein